MQQLVTYCLRRAQDFLVEKIGKHRESRFLMGPGLR